MKKSIRDVDVRDKRVLVRVDFNVPLDRGRVADDTRIRAALPTVDYLVENRARVILCSHLGRPKGKPVKELRMDPVADTLSTLLGKKVIKLDVCVGPEAEAASKDLAPGGVLLLENTRFYPGEKANDPEFASQLARLAELFVNDAFAAAHRAHASTEGVARLLPAVSGLLLEREIMELDRALHKPPHPFVVILGGAKVSDKIGVIERLLDRVDAIMVGGGMANTLLKAGGFEVGRSLVEEDKLGVAEGILQKAGDKLILPVDAVIAGELRAGMDVRAVPADKVPPDMLILDIGPRTAGRFLDKLDRAKMVVWNGPMGAAEISDFAEGSYALARKIAELDAVTIVGGGDTVAVLSRIGLADRMTHVSTGGGAFLEYMQGETLPGIAVLNDR